MMQPDLAPLFSAAREAEFRAALQARVRQVWPAEPGFDPDRFLTLAALGSALERDFLPADRLHLIRGGAIIAPSAYRAERGQGPILGQAYRQILRQGASVVIDEASAVIPSLPPLLTALARRYRTRAKANLYVSCQAGGALPPHADYHDALVLQLHGHKRWRCYGPGLSGRAYRGPDAPPPEWQGVLAPGSLLFMPRGEVHEAEVEGGISVHVTFGLDVVRGIDFLKWILARTEAAAACQAALSPLLGATAQAGHEQALKAALSEAIAGASLDRFLAEREQALPHRAAINLAWLGGLPDGDFRLSSALGQPASSADGPIRPVVGVQDLGEPASGLLTWLTATGGTPTLADAAAACGLSQTQARAAAAALMEAGLVLIEPD